MHFLFNRSANLRLMDENERDMMNQMTSVMQMAEMMAMAQAGSTAGDPVLRSCKTLLIL